MRPVVVAEARILQIRNAKAGEFVSYGATHQLARDSRLAIVGAGYADGWHRSLSGSGVPLRATVRAGGHGVVAGQQSARRRPGDHGPDHIRRHRHR
jgi:alanine racemase